MNECQQQYKEMLELKQMTQKEMSQLLDNQQDRPPASDPSWAKSKVADDDYGDQAISVATPDVVIESERRDKGTRVETEMSAPRGAALNMQNLSGDSDAKL